jgi:tetratricopeptide (TPR) repeat protein
LADEVELVVPVFDNEDIEEMLIANGYEGEYRESYSKILLIQTSGHPQLLHARVRALSQENWQLPDLDELLTSPKDIQIVKDEISSSLSAILHDNQRELLYRLSLITMSFRRGDAVKIGSLVPEVQRPGEVFNSLVGPWIEPRSGDRYSVTILLQRAAQNIWSDEVLQQLHRGIVASILSVGSLNQYDSVNVFFHAWQGKDYVSLTNLMYHLITKNGDEWKGFADYYHWITYIGTGDKGSPILDNRIANNYLRMLQFKVATEVNTDMTSTIATKWHYELSRRVATLSTPKEKASHILERVGFAVTILNNFQACVTIEILMNAFVELYNAIQLSESLTGEIGEMVKESFDFLNQKHDNQKHDFIQTTDPIQLFFIFASMRKLNGSQVSELFDRIKELPFELRKRILATHDCHAESARMLIENIWLPEEYQDNPNWKSCIEAIDIIRNKVEDLGDTKCAIECVRSVATIYDEYIGDCDSALAYLEEHKALRALYPEVYLDKEAMIYFHKGDFTKAVELWDNAIPQMPFNWSKGDPWSLYSSRFAAIAATKLGEWDKAAQYFSQGKARSEYFLYGTEYILAFQADLGFALWKAGKHDESIRQLIDVGEAFLKMDRIQEQPTVYSIYRLFCHSFTWITMVSGESSKGSLKEPVPGMCSNPDKHPGIKELPFVPLEMLKGLIVKGATMIHESCDNSPYDGYIRDLKSSSNPMVRTMIYLLEFDKCLESGQLDDLFDIFYNIFKYGKMNGEALIDDNSINWLDLEEYIFSQRASLIVPAALAASTKGIELSSILSTWRNKRGIFRIFQGFESWFDSINKLWYDDSIFLYKHIANYDDSDKRALVALKLIFSDRTEIRNMYLSQLFVFDAIKLLRASKLLFAMLEQQICDYWRRMIVHPFSLKYPSINVPEFRRVFNDDTQGEQRIARVLLVAKDAVNISSLSAESLDILRKSAELS